MWPNFPWGCSCNVCMYVCAYRKMWENEGILLHVGCILIRRIWRGQYTQLRTFWRYFTLEGTLPRHLSCSEGCLKYCIEQFSLFFITHILSLLFPPIKCQYNPNSWTVPNVHVCNASKSTEHVSISRGSAPSLHSHSASPLSLAPTIKANSDCLQSELCAMLLFLGMGGWEAKAFHFPQPMKHEGCAGNRCIRKVCTSARTLTHTQVYVTRTHTGHHH